MSKLMIINCAADTSMHDGVEKRFHDSEVLASSVKKGWEAVPVFLKIVNNRNT